MFFLGGIACAAGILRRGQEKGEGRIREYGRALRRTHGAKDRGPSGCRPAGARGVARLDRWTPHRSSPCSWRITSPERQRRLFPSKKNMLQRQTVVLSLLVS